jgi:hypothetical protein
VGLLRRRWLQILLSGIVLLILVERTLIATSDPNYAPSVILLGAFLVPVTFVTYSTSSCRVGMCPCRRWRCASCGVGFWGR